MGDIKKIVLIGAGNVGTHLGLALHDAGLDMLQVFSRNHESAGNLAALLEADPVHDPAAVSGDADLYVLAVSDDAIGQVAQQIRPEGKFLVHTSGSVPMDIFRPFTAHYGVIYPLQTFSRHRKIDFRQIPVCLEANSISNMERLNRLVSEISEDVRSVPSDQRRLLHLAAVFACNFPNYMYRVAEGIVNSAKLDFDILRPLILETAMKVQEAGPLESQTGPARRGDREVMEKHLALLSTNPDLQRLYKEISGQIGHMESKGKN